MPQRGQLFWYESKTKVYGALVIDVPCFSSDCLFLAAITEALDAKKVYTVADLINAPLYTLAWFYEDDLIPEESRHNVFVFDIKGDYNGKFGFSCSNGGVELSNWGMSSTWSHECRSFAWQGKTIASLLESDKNMYSDD